MENDQNSDDQPTDSQKTDYLTYLDKRLDTFEEHLKNQSKYLYHIKNHFVPEEEDRREKRWKKYFAVLTAKICLLVGAILGSWDLVTWYLNNQKITRMAERYAVAAIEMYEKENNPEVALKYIDRAIELKDNHPEYRYRQAYFNGMVSVRQLLNLDRPYTKAELDEAHQALAQAIVLGDLDSKRAEPYILRGQIYAVLKKYDQAFEEINRAISIDKKNDYAYARLGMLHFERKEIDKSMEAFEKALAINPKSKWAWLWKGIVLAEQNNVDSARQAYRKALDLDDRFDLAWYNYGMTWMNHDYQKVIEIMGKAIEINPNYKEAYYAFGLAYGHLKRYDTAKVYLDKAIALDNTFLTALKWRGIVWEELEKYEEALADFNRAIELDPKSAELYRRRARTHVRLGELNNAIIDLRFSLELDPNNARTHLYLGNVFLRAGEASKALEYYEKALQIKKDYDDVYAQMAKAYEALNQIDKAIEAVSSALNVTTYHPENFYCQRGALHESANDTPSALADYVQARTIRTDYAEAWLSEAKLLKKMKKFQEALEAVNAYFELRPQDKEAQKLKDRLMKQQRAESR